jgi:hypothetical protein
VTANKKWCIGGAKRTSNPHAEPIEKAEIVLVLLKHYMYVYWTEGKRLKRKCRIGVQ